MRLKNTMIAYNPNSDQVMIGPLLNCGDADWTEPYSMTTGACEVDVRGYSGIDARHYIMSTFIGMVVRDGVDLMAVHKAFMGIDEYRDAIPPDMN